MVGALYKNGIFIFAKDFTETTAFFCKCDRTTAGLIAKLHSLKTLCTQVLRGNTWTFQAVQHTKDSSSLWANHVSVLLEPACTFSLKPQSAAKTL